MLGQLENIRCTHLQEKRSTSAQFQHSFQTRDLISDRQLSAKTANELEEADQQPSMRPCGIALSREKQVEFSGTNNLDVPDVLREFNSIRQSFIADYLKKKLTESGYAIRDNAGGKDNCAFHSIARQLMPKVSAEKDVARCAGLYAKNSIALRGFKTRPE
ncbi:hypothetical protein [Caballeronia calidae]|uniref:hypothetical protein n=1 Tax=Caballeronia calidae TaxID=1777139 RepID=UPI000AA2AF51|nr:hypothetical protein [Caballeronia calidae]